MVTAVKHLAVYCLSAPIDLATGPEAMRLALSLLDIYRAVQICKMSPT